MEILTPWIGEILALGMLLVLNARVFWTRRTRLDALSLLGATAFVTMIFETLAWGLRVSGVAILALSFICVIVNYRSLVRFSQRLFVDSYSIKFFVTSLLLLAASVFFIAAAYLLFLTLFFTGRFGAGRLGAAGRLVLRAGAV